MGPGTDETVKLAAVTGSSKPKKALPPVARPPVKLTFPDRKFPAILEKLVPGPK
jgi:hypothetical protein